VYLCYGIHWMLNLTTGVENDPHAVLIRSCDVVHGLATVLERRRAPPSAAASARSLAKLVAGPGKVAQALALDGTWNHHDLCAAGGLEVHAASDERALLVGARVGIDYAAPADRKAMRRYALAGCDAVTERAGLFALDDNVSRRRTGGPRPAAKKSASRR
jgi:DNA-3-methyladenine glycosylase